MRVHSCFKTADADSYHGQPQRTAHVVFGEASAFQSTGGEGAVVVGEKKESQKEEENEFVDVSAEEAMLREHRMKESKVSAAAAVRKKKENKNVGGVGGERGEGGIK